MNAFREAYKSIDINFKNKNILVAGASYLLAMNMVQDYRHEVKKNKSVLDLEINTIEKEERTIEREQIKIYERENSFIGWLFGCENDETRKNELENRIDYLNRRKTYLTYKGNYLNLSEEYGKFWFNKLSAWAPGAFNFPIRHITGNLENWETQHDFNNPNVDLSDFGNVVNILSTLGEKTSFCNMRNFNIDVEEFNRKFTNESNYLRKLTTWVNKDSVGSVDKEIQELKDLQKQINKAGKMGAWLHVLNLSMLMALKASELSTETINSNTCDYEYLQNAKLLANDFQKTYKNIAIDLFKKIYLEINNYNPDSDYVLGYENIEKFSK